MNKRYLQYSLVLIGMAFWGPFYRSILDKLWVLNSGILSVGKWAQLQTWIDFMSAPITAGIAIGLSIFTAQKNKNEHMTILFSAYLLGIVVTLPLLFLSFGNVQKICTMLGFDELLGSELVLSAIGGFLSIASSLLCGHFIGRDQQYKALLLIFITTIPNVLVLYVSAYVESVNPFFMLLYSIIIIGIGCNAALILKLYQYRNTFPYGIDAILRFTRQFLKFIPTGFAIGMLSSLCILMTRNLIAVQENWLIASQAVALWRLSDWILAPATTILYFHFLPVLSRNLISGNAIFIMKEIMRNLFLPCILALSLLILFRNQALHFFYDAQFVVPFDVAFNFWVGDALRILAAIFLMGLYAMHATKLIMIFDLFSQPLFVILLFMGMASSLLSTGFAFLLTYFLYSAMCIAGFIFIVRQER
ncbi:hypothetical protein G6734_00060 [Polynucleobacter paneuropaeus]|nr:hypothetical protein [Polynucleobacter paneuropaeus]